MRLERDLHDAIKEDLESGDEDRANFARDHYALKWSDEDRDCESLTWGIMLEVREKLREYSMSLPPLI